MFANDEAFQKVVNGTAAENLRAYHQDWKFMYRAQHLSDATILRCNGAVAWVNIASNDVDD